MEPGHDLRGRPARAPGDGDAGLSAGASAEAAVALLDLLGGAARAAATCAFDDPARTAWTYLPGDRPGVPLHALDREQAVAAFRLLATGLSPHAYAQAATVSGLEDVLDRSEGGRRGRHRGDAWLLVAGAPGERRWGWRLGAHHLAVTVTVVGDEVRGTPLFLGANPARTLHRGRVVLAPLDAEEQRGFALVGALSGAEREVAVVADEPPSDLVSGDETTVGDLPPAGLAIGDLGAPAARLAGELVDLFLDRLPAPLADEQRGRVDVDAVRFSWAGGDRPGQPHHWRLHGERLLAELANVQDGANHVHSVLRDPLGDFGADLTGG